MKHLLAVLGLVALGLLAIPTVSDTHDFSSVASVDKATGLQAELAVPSDGLAAELAVPSDGLAAELPAVAVADLLVVADHSLAPAIPAPYALASESTRPPADEPSPLRLWRDISEGLNQLGDGEGRGPVPFPLLC